MTSVYLSRILDFVRDKDGSMIANYSLGSWDILVMWDTNNQTNKAVGNATDFTRALRMTWRQVNAIQGASNGN